MKFHQDQVVQNPNKQHRKRSNMTKNGSNIDKNSDQSSSSDEWEAETSNTNEQVELIIMSEETIKSNQQQLQIRHAGERHLENS